MAPSMGKLPWKHLLQKQSAHPLSLLGLVPTKELVQVQGDLLASKPYEKLREITQASQSPPQDVVQASVA